MSDKELRELDAWISEHVMGLSLCTRHIAILEENEFVLSIPSKIVRARIGNNPTVNFEPTIYSAATMEVLKKCAEHMKNGIWGIASPMDDSVASTIKKPSQGWVVGFIGKPSNFDVEAETLELAICLFAKKLYSK